MRTLIEYFFGSLLEAIIVKDANIDLIKCSKI